MLGRGEWPEMALCCETVLLLPWHFNDTKECHFMADVCLLKFALHTKRDRNDQTFYRIFFVISGPVIVTDDILSAVDIV